MPLPALGPLLSALISRLGAQTVTAAASSAAASAAGSGGAAAGTIGDAMAVITGAMPTNARDITAMLGGMGGWQKTAQTTAQAAQQAAGAAQTAATAAQQQAAAMGGGGAPGSGGMGDLMQGWMQAQQFRAQHGPEIYNAVANSMMPGQAMRGYWASLLSGDVVGALRKATTLLPDTVREIEAWGDALYQSQRHLGRWSAVIAKSSMEVERTRLELEAGRAQNTGPVVAMSNRSHSELQKTLEPYRQLWSIGTNLLSAAAAAMANGVIRSLEATLGVGVAMEVLRQWSRKSQGQGVLEQELEDLRTGKRSPSGPRVGAP